MKQHLLSSDEIFSERKMFVFLFFYIMLLYSSVFALIQNFAIFYYWDWGRHLALSYYDGPPMIAYILRIITDLFGSHLYVINILAITFQVAIAFVIYKIAMLFKSKQVALVACLLWVLSPMTTQYIFRYITYDSPLNLFWAMSIYFGAKYCLESSPKDLYLTGMSMGLMMLSKYTGVILVAALLSFLLVNPKQRDIFKTKHFYFSTLLALIIFSPVLVWNMQHQWVSFTYQLSTHSASGSTFWGELQHAFKLMIQAFLPILNFLPFIIVYGYKKRISDQATNSSMMLSLLLFISIFFYIFYLVALLKVNLITSWLMPGLISVSILAAYFINAHKLKKTFCALIVFYLIADGAILLVDTVFNKQLTVEGGRYKLMEKFNQQYPDLKQPVFTSSYMSARLGFYIKNQPAIYTVPGCGMQNQYAQWSKPMLTKIKQGKITSIIYFDLSDTRRCIQPYFSSCQALPRITYQQKNTFSHKVKHYELYLFRCSNKTE